MNTSDIKRLKRFASAWGVLFVLGLPLIGNSDEPEKSPAPPSNDRTNEQPKGPRRITAKLLVNLKGKRDSRFLSVVFSPDGKLLAAGDGTYGTSELLARVGGALNVWNVEDKTTYATFYYPCGVARIYFTPDSKMLVGDGKGWDIAIRKAIDDPCLANAEYSPDGKILVSLNKEYTGFDVWKVDPPKIIHTIMPAHADKSCRGIFSPDGETFVTIDNQLNLKYWNTKTWETTKSQKIDPSERLDRIDAMLSPDSKFLYVDAGLADKLACFKAIIDVRSGKVSKIDPLDKEATNGSAFSKDGRFLVTVGSGGARIWSAENGSLLCHITALRTEFPNTEPIAMAFSPDGKLLATAGYDRVVRLWSLTEENPEDNEKAQPPDHRNP